MSHRSGHFSTLAALAALAGMLAGCGDDTLWQRWQAERAAWHAARMVARIRLEPTLASEAQWTGAERAYRAIAARWPAATWAPRSARAGAARDVALTVGRAVVADGAFEELRGRPQVALERYETALRDWSAVGAVALDAWIARARLLDAQGRDAESAAAWAQVATFDAFGSGEHVREEVLDAPLLAARTLADMGEEHAADSLLTAAAGRFERMLAVERDPLIAAAVWTRLGEARASLGDAPGAYSALRRVLAIPEARAGAPQTVLLLAQRALDLGQADTSRAYARWARDGFGRRARAAGLRLEALAWEASGPPDSALAVWATVIDDYGDAPDLAAEARSRRATLLERLGRWEQARSEYRALSAAEPTHALALAGLLRIVAHHHERGEDALARIEGAQAIEMLDRIIATQHDQDVSFGARQTRAEVLEQLGDAGAEQALTEVWRSDPGRPGAATAGLAAARRALARPGGRAAAESLFRDVAERSVVGSARRAAEAELDRLRSGTERGDR